MLKSRQEYIDTLKAHAAELQSRFGISTMRLFGSVARNEHHEGSDIGWHQYPTSNYRSLKTYCNKSAMP